MKNWLYALFAKKHDEPDYMAYCVVETESKALFEKALQRVKEHNLEITAIYKPDTIIEKPDFISCINI